MSDSKDYKWNFDLVEFQLTSGVKDDYTARVKTNNSLTAEDIAAMIASDRTDLREDTILMVAKLYDAKVIEKVCMGNSVVTGAALFQPSITGVFSGTSGSTTIANQCKVSINPSAAFRSSLDEVTLAFTGNVKDLGGADISEVTDVETELTEGEITPGGSLVIIGSKIRIVDSESSEDKGCVRFVNVETNEATDVYRFAINTPKKVVVNVPSTLAAGTYTIQIVTAFTNGNTTLKTMRTIEARRQRTVTA